MWLLTEFGQKGLDEVLKELEIIPLPKPIMDMSLKEIRKYFGFANGSIQMGMLLRNLIWQIYGQIQAGKPPDFVQKHGNIRSMWYYIKKKFSQHHALRGDRYGLMVKNLTLMVRKGLFSYAEFNFRDTDQGNWKLGFDNPHIILLAEKEGFITVMEDLQKTYGCHVFTAGGIPSFLTVNYMASALRSFDIGFEQRFYILSFSDFDPSGYNVAETFVEQLGESGYKNLHLFEQWGDGKKRRPWLELATPQNFNKDPKDFRFILPKKTWDDPSTKAWIKLTGGLDSNWKPGQKTHGLESDEFDLDLIHELFTKALKPLLKTPSDDIKRINAMQTLRQETEQMAIVKFLKKLKEA